MTRIQKKPEIDDRIPEFLPKVVENQDETELMVADESSLGLEVISETVECETPTEPSVLEDEFIDHQQEIMETEVEAETLSSGVETTDHSVSQISTDSEELETDDLTEGLLGFSIFGGSFRCYRLVLPSAHKNFFNQMQ